MYMYICICIQGHICGSFDFGVFCFCVCLSLPRNLPSEVHFFLYTVHLPSAGIAQKTGAVVLRRGARQYTLLTYLFQTQLILGVTSPVLTELLQLEKLLLPTTSSKATKIRKLMTCDAVKAAIGEDILAMIESKLLSQEKKRKKNGDKADENAEGCDDQEAEAPQLVKVFFGLAPRTLRPSNI